MYYPSVLNFTRKEPCGPVVFPMGTKKRNTRLYTIDIHSHNHKRQAEARGGAATEAAKSERQQCAAAYIAAAATKSERQCFHFIPQKSRCITNTQRMQQPQYYIRPYLRIHTWLSASSVILPLSANRSCLKAGYRGPCVVLALRYAIMSKSSKDLVNLGG